MSRPNPNARAIAKMKNSEVPLNTTDPSMDPEMRSTLADEQTRVASRKATFTPLAGGASVPSGWSKILGMFNGNSQMKKPAAAPIPSLSPAAKKYYGH